MFKNMKKTTKLLVGAIVTAAVSVFMFIGRSVTKSELDSIKDSIVQIVLVGSKQMSRSEYIDYATSTIRGCTAIAIVFLIAAVVLFALYYVTKKKEST